LPVDPLSRGRRENCAGEKTHTKYEMYWIFGITKDK
jgi:hypothetical protein